MRSRSSARPSSATVSPSRSSTTCRRTWPLSSNFRTSDVVAPGGTSYSPARSEEHTSELQSQSNLVCRLLLEKKKNRDASDPTVLPSLRLSPPAPRVASHRRAALPRAVTSTGVLGLPPLRLLPAGPLRADAHA